jgi:hypothetical protein
MEVCEPTKGGSVMRRGRAEVTYFNLQDLVTIAANAAVMHFMVCVICISTAFILDECEAINSIRRERENAEQAYSLLEALRGAGISQRTSRPNLDDKLAKGR